MYKVHLIVGDDFRCGTMARDLINKYIPEPDRVFGVEQIDADFDDSERVVSALLSFLASLKTPSFIAGAKKAIWFRNANFMDNPALSDNRYVSAALDKAIDELKNDKTDSVLAIITARSIDKRKSIYKKFESFAEVFRFEQEEKKKNDVSSIRDAARSSIEKYNLKINDDVVDLIIGRAGDDFRQIENEIEKLAVYAGRDEYISISDAELLVPFSRELPAWDLSEAFASRDLKNAIVILRQLLFQKVHPLVILLGLLTKIRELIFFRTAIDQKWIYIANNRGKWKSVEWRVLPETVEFGLTEGFFSDPRKYHPYRQLKLYESASRFSSAELEKCRASVASTYEKIVSASTNTAFAEVLLELMLIKITPAARL